MHLPCLGLVTVDQLGNSGLLRKLATIVTLSVCCGELRRVSSVLKFLLALSAASIAVHPSDSAFLDHMESRCDVR